MHIGINTLSLPSQRTGGGKYISYLVDNLCRLDRSNSYSIFANRINIHEFHLDDRPNLDIIDGGFMTNIRPSRLVWEQVFLPRQARKRKIDLFHSPGFVAPLGLKCRSVVTIFDMTFFLFPGGHTLPKRLYFGFFLPLSARKADMVITISESSKNDIIRFLHLPEEKVRVIYPGVDDIFRPVKDNEKLERVKARYGIRKDFILSVGVVEPRKNLDRLIRAFNLLVREDGFGLDLVIVGKKGWAYGAVLDLPEQLGLEKRVIFTGYVPEEDLPLLYSAASLFVYPSIYEGFGIPVLEAMACGTPVITSNVSSLPEVTGDAGLLVDPYDIQAMVQAIKKLLGDEALRKRMREAGLRWARQFSWEKMALSTLEVYKKALGA